MTVMMNKSNSPIIFGEVLFDCFPDGRQVLGGAPFNVAWHCQAFGLSPILISRIGKDALGEKIKSAMQDWGMGASGLQLDGTHPTGKVEVSFSDGEPSYEIVAGSAWDYIDESLMPEMKNNLLLYHGSLALRNDVSRSALNWLKSKHDIPVFVDINLRAPWWDLSTIQAIMNTSDWLKLSEEELAVVKTEYENITDAMKSLLTENSLETLIVTRGEEGASVLDRRSRLTIVSPVKNIHVVDTVGAGDAFSSIMLVGLYYDWPLFLTLDRAQEFASAIVGIQGATINDTHFYQPFIEDWQLGQ